MGIRVRAGGVNRCLLVGHVEVDKFEAGAGGEQRLGQSGEHGTQFSTVSLPLHQQSGRTTKSWQPQFAISANSRRSALSRSAPRAQSPTTVISRPWKLRYFQRLSRCWFATGFDVMQRSSLQVSRRGLLKNASFSALPRAAPNTAPMPIHATNNQT